ncbi:signal peptide peptidase SppA [Virgibacillus soli]
MKLDKKRWVALGIAVGLFIVSIISQLTATVKTANIDNFMSAFDTDFVEEVIEDGDFDKKIAVIHLDGIIQDDGSASVLTASGYNHDRFLKMLDEAKDDPFVKGVIIRVNTPGGGVVESAEIHDKVIEIQEEKPVYISMGNTAASGGYYISAPAKKIIAHPATLTGSIGVIMEGINFAEFAEKHGFDFNTIKSGAYKDIMSSSREMTPEERNILQTMIDEMYGDFVKVIADGRGISESKVREIGDGRVYTGSQAKEVELVDELGSLDDTIEWMKEDYKLDTATVVAYEEGIGLGLGSLFGITTQNLFGAERDIFGIRDAIRESNAPRAMYLYSR